MTRQGFCCLALVAGLTTSLVADDRFPPPWRGQDNSVFGEYVGLGGPGAPLLLGPFEFWDLTPGDGNDFNSTIPPSPIAAPDFDGVFWTYNIEFPNFIDDLPEKWMQIQLTFDSFGGFPPPEVYVQGVDATGPVTTFGDGFPAIWDPDFALWDIRLEPNPDFEFISIRVFEDVAIRQLVIDTISIPSPGAIMLVGAGVLATWRRR